MAWSLVAPTPNSFTSHILVDEMDDLKVAAEG